MTLLEFMERFGTEDACRECIYQKRWPAGFVCPKCGHTEHFNIKSRNKYQCKACAHQTMATVGTIMDKTRTPLTKWFVAMYLVAEGNQGFRQGSREARLRDKHGRLEHLRLPCERRLARTAIPHDPQNQPEHLHWTHIIISNAKAFEQGTFHGLDAKHLQRYLDEFCYRLNRRFFDHDLFSRLVGACALAPPKPHYALIE